MCKHIYLVNYDTARCGSSSINTYTYTKLFRSVEIPHSDSFHETDLQAQVPVATGRDINMLVAALHRETALQPVPRPRHPVAYVPARLRNDLQYLAVLPPPVLPLAPEVAVE